MNEHKHRLKQTLPENTATAQNHLPLDQASAAPLILITDQQLHQRKEETTTATTTGLDTIETSKSSNLSIISTLPLPNAGSFNSSLTTSVSSSLSASSSSSSSTTNLNQQASLADCNSPSKFASNVSSSSNCSSSNHQQQQQQQSLKPDSLGANSANSMSSNSISLSHDTGVPASQSNMPPVVVTQISNYYNDHLVGHGHFFSKKTFHKPTYCHHCTEMFGY